MSQTSQSLNFISNQTSQHVGKQRESDTYTGLNDRNFSWSDLLKKKRSTEIKKLRLSH